MHAAKYIRGALLVVTIKTPISGGGITLFLDTTHIHSHHQRLTSRDDLQEIWTWGGTRPEHESILTCVDWTCCQSFRCQLSDNVYTQWGKVSDNVLRHHAPCPETYTLFLLNDGLLLCDRIWLTKVWDVWSWPLKIRSALAQSRGAGLILSTDWELLCD